MPSRQNIKTIVTPIEIQGDDAWVKIKSITIDEAKELQAITVKIDKELEPERQALFEKYAADKNKPVSELTETEKLTALSDSDIVKKSEEFLYKYLSDYVMGWNWVLEDETPMLQPHKNPDAFGILTTDEFKYIRSLFETSSTEEKK